MGAFLCVLASIERPRKTVRVKPPMISVFGDQPFIVQLLPALDKGIVVAINRAGQVLVVFAGFLSIYQDAVMTLIKRLLLIISYIVKELCHATGWRWEDDNFGFELGSGGKRITDQQVQSDALLGLQLVISVVVMLTLMTATGTGPLGWLAYPFEFLWQVVATWLAVKGTFVSVISIVAETVGRIFAFPFVLVLSLVACAIVIRPYGSMMSLASKHLSVGHYRSLNFFTLVLGGTMVLVAT